MSTDRVVVLVDMDCFYVQVEQRARPELRGKPCAVVQYNSWKGGGIIAVSYEARAKGVTRQMRGQDAKAKCPEIQLVQVPVVRDKADLTRYRDAGAEVIQQLCQFSACVERASVDEAYIDLTEEVNRRLSSTTDSHVSMEALPNTHIVCNKTLQADDKASLRDEVLQDWLTESWSDDFGCHDNRSLAVAGVIVEQMRAAIWENIGFRCSAGIAHNKMLAKLACGINKPNKQTILPQSAVPALFLQMPITKVRHFGGKFGSSLAEQHGVQHMGELCQFSKTQLLQWYGEKTGPWLYEACRGVEHEAVTARQLAKSLGCGKTFNGKEQLDTVDKLKHWLQQLSEELVERLIKDRELNKRTAKHLSLWAKMAGGSSGSRSCSIVRYEVDKISKDCLALLQKFNVSPAHQKAWSPAIITLGLSADKFVDSSRGPEQTLKEFFTKASSSSISTANTDPTASASQTSGQGSPVVRSASGQRSTPAKTHKVPRPGGIRTFFTPKTEKSANQSLQQDVQSAESANHSVLQEAPSAQDIESANKSTRDTESANHRNPVPLDSSLTPTHRQRPLDVHRAHNSSPKTNPSTSSSSFFNKYLNSKESPGRDAVSSDSDVAAVTSENKSQTKLDNSDLMACPQCQQILPVWEMPEHSDYHFAVSLQETDRHTDRQTDRQTNQSINPLAQQTKATGQKRKAKASKNSCKKPCTSTIAQFFKKDSS